MAHDESNREDLLREATALVERIELIANASTRSIVVGFRADGALSVFFGDDPVYQFNAAGELRRAYCGGLLFKAMRGRLISLSRVRGNQQVQLVRHELSDREQAGFLTKMAQSFRELTRLLSANGFEVRGQVPDNADVLGHVKAWFADRTEWPIADRPNA